MFNQSLHSLVDRAGLFYKCIYPTPPPQTGCDTMSFFLKICCSITVCKNGSSVRQKYEIWVSLIREKSGAFWNSSFLLLEIRTRQDVEELSEKEPQRSEKMVRFGFVISFNGISTLKADLILNRLFTSKIFK